MSFSWRSLSAAFASILIMGSGVSGLAFQSDSGQTVTTEEPKSNYHVSANTITVSQPISKDLVAAGQTILVTSPIERNALLAGNQITLSGGVGGSVRVAGNQLTLSGEFNDDVILAGNQVTITDAVIDGDLVVGANEVSLINTQVTGDFLGGYESYTGDELAEQVEGELNIRDSNFREEIEQNRQEARPFAAGAFVFGVLWREIGVIAALLILTLFLKRRNRLTIPSLKLSAAGKHLLLGLVFTLVGPFIGGFLVIAGGPTAFSLVATLVGLSLLSGVFLPVYLANLFKNSLGFGLGIFSLTWLTYFGLLVLNLVGNFPVLGFFLGTLVFLAAMANLGYVLLTLWRALSMYLAPRKAS